MVILDNIVPIVNNLNNQTSLHDVIEKHEPENKFLKSIVNNLIGKDEESNLEPIISKSLIGKDEESLIDAKNSLNILVNSIKRAHGLPVEDNNWLNLPKPNVTNEIETIAEPNIVDQNLNVLTDVNSQDTVLVDNTSPLVTNCFYSSNLTNKLKLIDSKKELVLKYSFNVKNNCRNAIKQFEIFTDSVVIIPDAERINLNKNVFNNKDRQIHLSDKVPELPVIQINPLQPAENKDTPVKTSKLSERISIIESIMSNRGLTYKNRKAEVARILEFDNIDFPREIEVGGFGSIESLIAHQKSDPKLTIIRNMVKTEPVRWDNQIVEYHNSKANIHIVKGALVFYRVKDNKLLPLISKNWVVDLGLLYHVENHEGHDKMQMVFQNCYYLPAIKNLMREITRSCYHCQKYKIHGSANLQKLADKKITAKYTFDLIFADLTFLSSDEGKKMILTIIDTASRRLWAYPLKEKTGTQIVESFKKLVKNDLNQHKIVAVRFDNGKEFANKIVKDYFKEMGTRIIYGTPYHSQGAGPIESLNMSLKERLKMKLCQSEKKTWVSILDDVVRAYNTSIHSSLKGLSPFQAYQKFMPEVQHVIPVSREQQEQLNDAERPKLFHRGDLVMNKACDIGPHDAARGLKPRWTGPYFITKRYEDNKTYLLGNSDMKREIRSTHKHLKKFESPSTRVRQSFTFKKVRDNYFPKFLDEIDIYREKIPTPPPTPEIVEKTADLSWSSDSTYFVYDTDDTPSYVKDISITERKYGYLSIKERERRDLQEKIERGAVTQEQIPGELERINNIPLYNQPPDIPQFAWREMMRRAKANIKTSDEDLNGGWKKMVPTRSD